MHEHHPPGFDAAYTNAAQDLHNKDSTTNGTMAAAVQDLHKGTTNGTPDSRVEAAAAVQALHKEAGNVMNGTTDLSVGPAAVVQDLRKDVGSAINGTTDLSVGPAAAVQDLREDAGAATVFSHRLPRLPKGQLGAQHAGLAQVGHNGDMQATAVMARAILSLPKIELEDSVPPVMPDEVHVVSHSGGTDLGAQIPKFEASQHLHPSSQEEFSALLCMVGLGLLAIMAGVVALCSGCGQSEENTRRPEDILAEVYAEAQKNHAVQNLAIVKSRFLVLSDEHGRE